MAEALAKLDDAELLRRCAERDERAWRTLVHRYQAFVYSAILRTGLDQDSAVDVFQQVWIELFRSVRRIRDPRGLPSWLAVSARRRAYRAAASGKKTINLVLEDLIEPSSGVDDELQELQEQQRMHQALLRLGGSCEQLLRYLFLQQPRPSYEVISARLNIAVGSIGPKRARCLERLRKLMETP